ncbi:hypothetical protein PIROE2DRAFT_9497, partial [Piromyces sp. E2]
DEDQLTKKKVIIEKNIPGFSTELYKPSVQPGSKERTILMILKDHEYVVRRMDQYYQENLMATTEDLDNLQSSGKGKEKSLIAEDEEFIVDQDGVTRKLKPGEKCTIFLDCENNDVPFTPRPRINFEDKPLTTTTTTTDATTTKATTVITENKTTLSPSQTGIQLAPPENYEENCRYLNEPKIVPRDQKIKVVFPGEEKEPEPVEPTDFLQSYIRNKKNAVKGDYMKEYKKYQNTLQEDIRPHPTGINLYEGAKTFLSQNQIQEIERLQHDTSLIPSKSNIEKAREKTKVKIKFNLPESVQVNSTGEGRGEKKVNIQDLDLDTTRYTSSYLYIYI